MGPLFVFICLSWWDLTSLKSKPVSCHPLSTLNINNDRWQMPSNIILNESRKAKMMAGNSAGQEREPCGRLTVCCVCLQEVAGALRVRCSHVCV